MSDLIFPSDEPHRTRHLLLLSAWWTLTQMATTGTSFDQFIELLASGDHERCRKSWGELTVRLLTMAETALSLRPEAALSNEVRHFIEAVVAFNSSDATTRVVEAA